MLYKMDKNGNIYQTDSAYDEETGVGQVPELVYADDVASLSEKEDDSVLKDRLTYKARQEARRAYQKALRLQKRMNELKKQRMSEKLKNKKFYELKRLYNHENQKRNAILESALKQKGNDYEKLSGVSGYGYTSDGKKPFVEDPVTDQGGPVWAQEIIETDVDFGRMPNNYQGLGLIDERQFDFGSNTDPYGAYLKDAQTIGSFQNNDETEGLKILPSVMAKVQGKGHKELPVTICQDMGAFTGRDKFYINIFRNGNYTINYRVNGRIKSYPLSTFNKQRIEDLNNKHLSLETKRLYFKCGFAWSGFLENGEFHLVKVPNVKGIPKVDPYISKRSKEIKKVQDWLLKSKEGDFLYFIKFKDIILAFARAYKVGRGELEIEASSDDVKKEILKRQDAEAKQFKKGQKYESFLSRLLWLIGGSDLKATAPSVNTHHPMKKYMRK